MHEERAAGLVAYWVDFPPPHILVRAALGVKQSESGDAPSADDAPMSLIDQFGGTRGARP